MGLADGSGGLVLSSRTLGDQITFEGRAYAAAAAGFAGVGLRVEDYFAARQVGLDDAAMNAILDRHHTAVREVEYLTGWGIDADRNPVQRHAEDTVFRMARAFGVRHVNAGLLEHLPVEAVVDGFAALCRRAGDLTVALEFMPYSGIPDLRTAWHIIREADQPNAALLIDAWHWLRAGTRIEDLEAVPAHRIVAVQLCDVGAIPVEPMRDESRHHRFPPGRGAGDVIGMVHALAAHGVDCMLTVEAMSEEIISCGTRVTTTVMMESAVEVLAAARARARQAAGRRIVAPVRK